MFFINDKMNNFILKKYFFNVNLCNNLSKKKIFTWFREKTLRYITS